MWREWEKFNIFHVNLDKVMYVQHTELLKEKE